MIGPTSFTEPLPEKWWQDPELNRGHKDFQSSALPTELSCQPFRARPRRLAPAIPPLSTPKANFSQGRLPSQAQNGEKLQNPNN